MSGTKAGGLKAVAKIKAEKGDNFYREIGRKGGLKSRGGGFTNNPERARVMGAIGGKKSKRGPSLDKKLEDLFDVGVPPVSLWERIRRALHG